MAKKKRGRSLPPSSTSGAAIIRKVAEAQSYFDKPVKQPRKVRTSVQKEISRIRSKEYRLRKKVDEAPNKYQKGKARKLLNQYRDSTSDLITSLKEKRVRLNTIIKFSDVVRQEKRKVRSKIAQVKKKIDKAEENKDWKEVERLRYQQLKREFELDGLNRASGNPPEQEDVDIDEYEPDTDPDRSGYIEDPANPYTIWQAITQLDNDLKSGTYQFFVINGSRYSSSHEMEIRAAASEFWITIKGGGVGTPFVYRYFKNNSVRYSSAQ